MLDYSIVIPVCNEEESIGPLHESIKKVMSSLGGKHEIIFINDGSTDETLQGLRDMEKNDPSLFVVSFGKNLGQTAALKVGFQMAKGKVVISMDGDLQNDPEDIPKLLEKLNEGYDAVCGWRRKRFDSPWKKYVSKFANITQRAIFKSNLHDISCTLRVYKNECVKDIDLSKAGMHRFIPYLLLEKGRKLSEVESHHHPRSYGKSKHGPSKVFRVVSDFLALAVRYRRKK